MLDEAVDVFFLMFRDNVRLVRRYNGQMRILMDANIRHVFTNIIKNALEAMPHGGELEISSQVKQAGLQIVFRDTGSGIPHDHQDMIFEPFFTTKPAGAGNGFGLAICKDIVARYGGRIAVKSTPGQGSVFTILFPKDIIV
jgi:two-component system NtrC family sensor kinase